MDLFQIAQHERNLPHENITLPQSIFDLGGRKLFDTAAAGIRLRCSSFNFRAAGPRTKIGLDGARERYREWGFDVEMVESWDEWQIVLRPQGEEAFLVYAGTGGVAPVNGKENPTICPEVSSSFAAFLVLSPKDDPKIYKKVRENGLAIAFPLSGNLRLDTLVLPGGKARRAGLIKGADNDKLYAISEDRVRKTLQGKDPGALLGHPVAIIVSY